jgi:hypothetical protein
MRGVFSSGFQTPPDSTFQANTAAVTPVTVFPELKSWGVWAGGQGVVSTTSSTTIWSGLRVQGGFPSHATDAIADIRAAGVLLSAGGKTKASLQLFETTIRRCAPCD